ncbi:lipid II:glycine glycyltransferase FemX [Arthrobacter castelli]|uniref:lipid II:glycine glycyltransferase FemX n=1 Tax=Arthrobacter castelli TaxID=271431 RepID=UPI0003FC5A8E|nr:peptidoglycan bridge formation glycyltransferase FemA/FemB family protein [Arthrobacter castelli]
MAPTSLLETSLLTVRKLNGPEFENLVAAYPEVDVPIEQSSHWLKTEESGPARRSYGLFAYYDDGILVATASLMVFTRRLRQSLVAINGPAWFVLRSPKMERRLVETMKDQARTDPDIDPLYIRLQVANPQIGVHKALEAGWYEREIVVDLTPTEDELLKSFRANARQSIRKATKAGVDVQFIEPEHRQEVFARDLYPILAETADRADFAAFESGYYERLLAQLPDLTRLAVAYHNGTAVSWLITTEYRGRAVYYFAGSSFAARGVYAPYILLWETFRVLKEAGNRSCGLTGIVSESYPQLANVTTFKRNWSKNEVDLPVTYDIPLDIRKYAVVGMYLKARREVIPRLVEGARKLKDGGIRKFKGGIADGG